MLIGNFDLYHPLWGRTLLPTQHTLADDLIETTAHGNMELILPQGIVTWRSGNSMSTLDLAFATSGTPTIYRSSHQSGHQSHSKRNAQRNPSGARRIGRRCASA
jgi:hypothetical protein